MTAQPITLEITMADGRHIYMELPPQEPIPSGETVSILEATATLPLGYLSDLMMGVLRVVE